MNKKLMAVAVAGALAAPAAVFAQASNVQIYGKLNLGFDNSSATGSAAGAAGDFKSRYRVYDSSSRLGFRGTENLGGGLSAVFLMESGVNVDTGSTGGQSGPSTAAGTPGLLNSRVGHVGLRGGWGLLTVGRSNVWWGNGTQDLTALAYVNASPGITTGTWGRGMGVGVTRVSNVVQYTSPVMSGMNAVISYSPESEASQAGANTDGKLWHVTLQGTWGRVAGGLDWVRRDTTSPAAGGQPRGTGTKLRGGWTYQPGASINLILVRSAKDNFAAGTASVNTAAPNLTQNGWALNWEHLMGNWRWLAQWGKVGNVSGCVTPGACDNTSMTGYLLGGMYLFSKRSWMYLTYNQIRNDSRYNQDFTGGGITSATAGGIPTTSAGADPRVVAVGMVHHF